MRPGCDGQRECVLQSGLSVGEYAYPDGHSYQETEAVIIGEVPCCDPEERVQRVAVITEVSGCKVTYVAI